MQVTAGAVNLQRHVANARAYGVPVVVAINKFASDTPAELDAVRTAALEAGGFWAGTAPFGKHSDNAGLAVGMSTTRLTLPHVCTSAERPLVGALPQACR